MGGRVISKRIVLLLRDNITHVISFLMPVLILGLIYVIYGMSPFGSRTILICDMNGQYVDFYATLHRMLTEGRSFFYSWQAGMGLNFIGLLAYYLASPLSLLIAFFDQRHLAEVLLLITLLKIGLAGLTFSVFARTLAGKEKKYLIVLSSLSYALMSYSIVYSFNIMWLDGVILLPLVIYGTERIIQNNRFLFLTFCLIILFIANFYIAYMVGLFAFVYFMVRYFSLHSFRELALFFRKTLYFLGAAVLGAGCAAFLLLPTVYALMNGQGESDAAGFLNWSINFALFDLFCKMPMGSYDTLTSRGLPNIYSGLPALLIMPLFFFKKEFPFKERLLHLGFIALLIFSFNFSNLDLMWHAFDYPTWFPYRYSFAFSFLILVLALRAASSPQKKDYGLFLKTAGIWLLLIVIIQKFDYPYISDRILMINLFLILIYLLTAFVYANCAIRKKPLIIFVAAVLVLELGANTGYLIKRMDEEFSYTTKQAYGQKLDILGGLISEIRQRDSGFYRMERVGGRSLNDAMNIGYNGISHFSSMANHKEHAFLSRLGFVETAGDKSVSYYGATLVTDSLFGVKYIITEGERGFGYQEILARQNYKVYENTYALPLAFQVNNSLLSFKAAEKNPFELQNDMIKLALGKELNPDLNCFIPLKLKEIILHNVQHSETDKGYDEYRVIDPSQEAFLEFSIRNPRPQQVYFYLPQEGKSQGDVYVNDKYVGYYLTVYNYKVMDLGYQQATDDLRVKVVLKKDSLTLTDQYFYGLYENNFTQAVREMQENRMEDALVTDRTVMGTVDVSADKTVLFTSIPYDPGWKALIDGKKAPVKKIGDAFIALQLPEGRHDVKLSFVPKGLYSGITVSIVSIFILASLILYRKYSKLQKIR